MTSHRNFQFRGELSASFFLLCLCPILFAQPSFAQTPSGWWKFTEGSGTIAHDSSGYGHNGTLYNGVTWVQRGSGYAVKANSSYRQYLGIPAINFSSTKAVTVTLWSNRTYSQSGGHTLFENTANFNNSTTGFALFPDSSTCGGIEADLKGNVGYVANCYSQPSSGVWHHLAVVYDKTQSGGSQVKLYIDAVLQPVTWNLYANTNTNYFGNNPFYVYSRGGSYEYSSGMIDDLRVYNIALTASQIQQIYNGGNGSGTLTASPSSLNFGNIYLNGYSTLQDTLTNTGSAPVTVSSITIAGAEFSLAPISTPFTLQPQTSAQLQVTFAPTVNGPATGTITVISNASDPTLVVPLSGNGVSNTPHSVALSWTASISSVIGYNLYRSTNSGGPYAKINSSLISVTNYTDQTVQNGTTYYYVSTAINAQNQESVYSNQAVAIIPLGAKSETQSGRN